MLYNNLNKTNFLIIKNQLTQITYFIPHDGWSMVEVAIPGITRNFQCIAEFSHVHVLRCDRKYWRPLNDLKKKLLKN